MRYLCAVVPACSARLLFPLSLLVFAPMILAPTPLAAQGDECLVDDPPPPPYCYGQPSVDPDGGTAGPHDPNTSGHSVVFTVQNFGTVTDFFSFSCWASAPVTCTSTSPSSATLAPNGSVAVTVFYSVGPPGTGSIGLDASVMGGNWDSGWFSVQVNSASPGVAVTPDGGSTPARTANTGGYSESFTVQNTGPAASTFSLSCSATGPVTCGSVSPPSVSLGGGASTGATVSYSVGAPGSGTLTLTANDGIVSDGGSYSVPVVSYGVAVTPDGQQGPTRSANTTGYSASFTVQNTGSASNTYTISCGSTAPVTCTGVSPASVSLGSGASTTVSAFYNVGAPGTGTITLTASGTNASDAGSYSIPVAGNGVMVLPDGQTVAARSPNTSGHSEAFSVVNTGGMQNTFNLSCSAVAPAICGSISPSSVTLNGGSGTSVTLFFSVGAVGNGTLTVTATGTGAVDNGSIIVPVVSYGVAVTPDGTAAPARPANTSGHSESFTVQNTGSASNTFSFTCNSAPPVTCGTVPTAVTLAAGAQTTVSMPFSVGAPGTGTLTLIASGTNASDPGSYSILVIGYGVSVTPDGGAAPARPPNTGGHSEPFTVTNTGTATNTYSFTCSGAGGVTCGTAPTAVSLGAGAQTTVSMPYSVGALGTGTLTLTATGTNASDQGSYSVPIATFGVTLTPDAGTAPTRAANTGGYSESFTLTNNGSSSNTFSFSCSGQTGVICGTAPSAVTLGAGAGTTVAMPYSVGAPGTGTLTLTATGSQVSDAGSYTVPIVAYGVAVTPDGGTAPARPSGSSGFSETFTIQNTGTASNTFNLSCGGTAPVSCSGVTPTSVTLGAGASTTASASYSTGQPGSGSLTLTASGTNASDAGSFTVSVFCANCFTPSTVAGGVFTKDSRYIVIETANTYDAHGRITQLADARNQLTNYEYGGNPPHNAFLTKVTRVNPAGPPHLVTDISYDTDGFVASIRDEGGSFRYFSYDLYGRLRQVKNNAQVVVRAYGYVYSRVSPSWTFDSAAPNAVIDTTFIQQTPAVKTVVSTQYVDGLGRPIQTVLRDGTNYHVTATQYDLNGREWREWKTYTRTTAGYDPNFVGNATAFYDAYHSPGTKPYTETAYTPDALSRVKQVTPEFIGPSAPGSATHVYGVDVVFKQLFNESADELGKRTRNYTDLFGTAVRTTLGYGSAEATTTQFTPDVLGQRLQATDPRGLITTYTYDTRGKLTGHSSPDGGTTASEYDREGNLRYTQDANQLAAGQVYFTSFDFANRPLISGQGAGTLASLDPDAATAPPLETTNTNWLVVRAYDAKPTNVFPWSLFWTQISPLTLTNVSGRLAGIASKSNGSWQVSLFSYDADGDVSVRRTYTHRNGTTTVLAALNTTVTYVRDLRDALTERRVTVGSGTGSSFNHWYDYDNRGLLWRTYASTSATKPGTADVTYTYRPSGQIETRQFSTATAVPLRYTIREQLEQIGNPATTTYPFSARYSYHANGTLLSAEFYGAGSASAQKRFRYEFGTASYDALNRLKSADFSSWSGTAWTTTLAHDLAAINYDLAGNITSLQRYRETATLIDNLTYSIPSTSNRLASVADAVGVTTETWDAEGGSFTYDANGNMKTAPAPYSVTAVTYNHQNLPESITRSGVVSTYRYDDAGKRIAKQVGTGNREMYVLDGEITLSVVTVNSSGTLQSRVWNIVAVEKVVGRLPNSGSRRYYHTDLLGSTRTVTSGVSVVESYDFEPWGLLMPGRTFGSGTKEGFTGKERDAESQLDYFGARYYMAALGRWGAVDPEADKFPQWSPYTYTLNNPLVLVDPDGRCPAFITGKPCSGAVALAVGFIPVVGDIVDVASAVVGKDLLTGERLSAVDRVATLAGTIVGSGRAARIGVRAASNVVEGVRDARRTATRVADAGQNAQQNARRAERTDDAATAVRVGEDAAQTGRKIPNSELIPPTRRGRAPTGSDGHPVELHHRNQGPDDALDEMTRTDHRLGDNFKKNHPNTGQKRSKIDRQQWRKQQRKYWEDEWDRGRWDEGVDDEALWLSVEHPLFLRIDASTRCLTLNPVWTVGPPHYPGRRQAPGEGVLA